MIESKISTNLSTLTIDEEDIRDSIYESCTEKEMHSLCIFLRNIKNLCAKMYSVNFNHKMHQEFKNKKGGVSLHVIIKTVPDIDYCDNVEPSPAEVLIFINTKAGNFKLASSENKLGGITLKKDLNQFVTMFQSWDRHYPKYEEPEE
mgnify:CR=1 FL=1